MADENGKTAIDKPGDSVVSEPVASAAAPLVAENNVAENAVSSEANSSEGNSAETSDIADMKDVALVNSDSKKNGEIAEKANLTVAETNDDTKDVPEAESQVKKIPYPKSVFFIISNEFCERFNYYGMRTILVLYLSRELNYSDDSATIIFHIFTMLVYFLCIFGAILSDSWLGKFKTILYLSLVYVCGSILITLGAIPPMNLPAVTFTMVGLSLIALGSGGIKPCVAAFGGDQFKLPEQVKQMTMFFSLFYFAINAGSLISTAVTPILREDVHCFDQKDCYPLAFGVPAILMAISIVIFVLGRPLYKVKAPQGNMVVLVSKTIGAAISTRWKEKKTNPRDHWLDYADKKFDKQLISDVKVLMRVLVLYLPLPVFWALFDQQGSRWTFQATRMDGDMGSWDIKPDQMQVLNPLLILVFIPLYNIAFYPALSLVGIRRPLQKLTMGGILAGIAFIISGAVELELEKTYPVVPSSGVSQLRVFNGETCNYTFSTNLPGNGVFDVGSLDYYEKKDIQVTGKTFTFTYTITSLDENCYDFGSGSFAMNDSTAYGVFMSSRSSGAKLIWYEDYVNKPSKGSPLGRTLTNVQPGRTVSWKLKNAIEHEEPAYLNNLTEFSTGEYDILVDNVQVWNTQLRVGGVYTYIIDELESGGYQTTEVQITEPNSVNILWLTPQYIIMTLGEVMFSVTGLEFSYAQAPLSMKSVLQACWLLTVAFGNVIVVIVAELSLFESQASEFFLFAGLMFVDMIVFMWLAYRYKPNNPNEVSETEPLTDPKHEIQELDIGIDNKAKEIED